MNSSTIKPLQDRVVVRRLTEEEAGTKSTSGIILPDSMNKEKPEQGMVTAVGEGKWDEQGGKVIGLFFRSMDTMRLRLAEKNSTLSHHQVFSVSCHNYFDFILFTNLV